MCRFYLVCDVTYASHLNSCWGGGRIMQLAWFEFAENISRGPQEPKSRIELVWSPWQLFLRNSENTEFYKTTRN